MRSRGHEWSQQTVAKTERSPGRRLSLGEAYALADSFGVTIDALVAAHSRADELADLELEGAALTIRDELRDRARALRSTISETEALHERVTERVEASAVSTKGGWSSERGATTRLVGSRAALGAELAAAAQLRMELDAYLESR